jgi:hypothetical protein
MKYVFLIAIFIMLFACFTVRADDFFDLRGIHYYQSPPEEGPAVFNEIDKIDENNHKIRVKVFVPCIQIRVSVKAQIRASSIIAHAYFYDSNKTLIGTDDSPAVVDQGDGNYNLPVILSKDKEQGMCFAVPDKVLQQPDWFVVVVFGDAKGVDAELYGTQDGQELDDFDYPEKARLEDKAGPDIERKPTMDPLIEHVVQTDNPQQPQITLFLRPPLGMTDASEAKGVLCLSLLAFTLDDVKRQLQGFEAGDDLSGILKFAEEHKLIIICWGSHGLWNPRKNWDDLSPDAAWTTDKAFDQVADAWANGVQYFVKEYGIPDSGYLLWGISGSGQYACRLALRKPEYFLAIHAHIPSSFDKPTPGANKILWCLTTGELEPGYQRSLRFYAQCQALGYPIIYKAIIGLGHAGSPIADNLGAKFFEYALTQKDKRLSYDKALNDPLTGFQMSQTDDGIPQPWIDSFRKPAFVGDIVNQESVPFEQQNTVPPGYRTPLPTKEIEQAWND